MIFESDFERYYMIHIFEVKIWKVPSAWYPLCGHTVDSFYRYYSLSLIWVFRIWYSSVHRIPWRSPWSYDRDYIAQLPGWVLPRGTDCFLGDPGVTIVYLRSMVRQLFRFGWFVWIVLSISVFKSFSSIFIGCWNKSTKYLENSSFAPDQRAARV